MTFIIVGKNVIYIQSYNLLGFLPLGNYWSVTPPFYVYEYIYKIHKMIPRGTKEPTFVANILHASCCTWYFIVILKITLQSMRFPFYKTRKWKFRVLQPVTFDEQWYKASNPSGKSKSFKMFKVLHVHTHPSPPLLSRISLSRLLPCPPTLQACSHLKAFSLAVLRPKTPSPYI